MPLDAPQYPPEVQDTTRGLRVADLVVPGARRGIAEDKSTLARTQPGKPFLGSTDMLIVTSQDDVTWRFEWDGRRWDLQPNKTLQIPFPAVVNLLGDPRALEGGEMTFRTETGQEGVICSRYDSLLTLMARYGIKDENVEALVQFAPRVTAKTLTGVDVPFPVHNPKMVAWPTPNSPEPGREQPTDMRQLVERYEAERVQTQGELSELREMVTRLLGSQADVPAPQGIPDPVQPAPGPGAGVEALLAAVPGAEAEDMPVGGATVDTGPRSQV